MYPASVIAYAFVEKGIEEGIPVTQMKLQKLVYFAHGLHLAQYQKPLIKEKFQAWKFGPVIPALYQDYKLYGSDAISDPSLLFLFRKKQEIEGVEIDNKSIGTLDLTWSLLKTADAVRLSAWTHEDGSPWSKYYLDNVSHIEIPNEEIRDYFTKKFIKQANGQ